MISYNDQISHQSDLELKKYLNCGRAMSSINTVYYTTANTVLVVTGIYLQDGSPKIRPFTILSSGNAHFNKLVSIFKLYNLTISNLRLPTQKILIKHYTSWYLNVGYHYQRHLENWTWH